MSADDGVVVLRAEKSEASLRHLDARLNSDGALLLTGHDLGEGIPFGDEYEYFKTIAADDLPRLVALLDGAPGTSVLDVLASWTGPRSYDLERLLRESDIDVRTRVV